MAPIYKYIIIFTVVGFTLGFTLTYTCLDNTMKSSKEYEKYLVDKANADTSIMLRNEIIQKIASENTALISDTIAISKERDFYKNKSDSLMKHIKRLTKVVIKPQDYKEASEWVKQHNSSLK